MMVGQPFADTFHFQNFINYGNSRESGVIGDTATMQSK